jgi:class 3 adenylate cyclase
VIAETFSGSMGSASPPFVGHQTQLEWMRARLDAALAGRPSLLLLGGEAGIGKTRLLHEVKAHALRLGFQTFFGRCHEHSEIPHVPQAEEAIEQWATSAAGADTESDWSAIRDWMHGQMQASAGLSLGSEREKLRLMRAISRATIAVAAEQPMLVLLDDLHWAGRISADMIAHLTFAIADAASRGPVSHLMICAYRPEGLPDWLADALVRLRRDTITDSLTLEGLTDAETHELIRRLGVLRPSQRLVAAVHEAARGNPSLIAEIVKHLQRVDGLSQQAGFTTTDLEPAALCVSDQVFAAARARLDAASDRCRRLLATASLLRETFPFELLRTVHGGTEGEVLDLLDEAIGLGLLVADGRHLRFAHARMRQDLASSLLPARRQRLHAHIAATLEQLHPDRLLEYSVEIAHHLAVAGAAADPRQRLDWGRRGGERALQLFAWADAARCFEAALEGAHEAAPRERAELHRLAGLAHYRNMDAGPCLEHYARAAQIHTDCGDLAALAETCMEHTRAQLTLASVAYGDMPDVGPLRRVLEELGEREPVLRGRILATLSEVYWTARQPQRAEEMASAALHLADEVRDDRLSAHACFGLAMARTQQLHIRDAVSFYRRAARHARRVDDAWLQGWPVDRLPMTLSWLGRLDDAERAAADAAELTRKTHDWGDHSLALAAHAGLAAARGEPDLCERLTHDTMLMVRRTGYPWGGALALQALCAARFARGAWQAAEEAVTQLAAPGEVFVDPGFAIQGLAWIYRELIRLRSGAREEVRAVAENLANAMSLGGTDVYALAGHCALIEIACALGEPQLVAAPEAILGEAARNHIVLTPGWPFLVSRLRGAAAALQRRWEDAESAFRAALATASNIGTRPELARTHIDAARMYAARAARGDRERAEAALLAARALCEELDMAPSAREAMEIAAQLEISLDERALHPRAGGSTAGGAGEVGEQPASYDAPQRQLRFLVFTDMYASTGHFERLGDIGGRELLRAHDALVRRCLHTHGGTEIKHTGDGFLVSFPSAGAALDCAMDIQRALNERNQLRPQETMHVRIGVHAGEPVAEAGELFGAAVHAAARICNRARPQQILVSEEVRRFAGGEAVRFADRGEAKLKGFKEPYRLYEVDWSATRNGRS